MSARPVSEVDPAVLRWVCDPMMFPFETTADPSVESSDLLTQQAKPLKALLFALGMRRLDYNVYVAGAPGQGKTRTVLALLGRVAPGRPNPCDWVYVFNFSAPDRPRALRLPPGQGRIFAARLKAAVERLSEDIKKVLQADPLATRREAIVAQFERARDERTDALKQMASERGFELRAGQLGPFAVPLEEAESAAAPAAEEGEGADPEGVVLEEQETPGDELAAKPTEESREDTRRRRQEVIDQLNQTMRDVRRLSEDVEKDLLSLEREAALQAISPVMEPLREAFAGEAQVLAHLDAAVDDMLDHLDLFLDEGEDEEGEEGAEQGRTDLAKDVAADALARSLKRYLANVVVDHAETTGAPVVTESHPTYGNLIGRIEQEATQGVLSTHFMMIKGGALHRAIGGFLVLRVDDLLTQPESWEALLRALRDQQLRLEDPQEGQGPFSTRWLKPEPIPLEGLRVILTGDHDTLEALIQGQPEFEKLFKVRAEFDDVWPRDVMLAGPLPGFVARLSREEGLLPFHRSAIAAIAEEAVRLAEDQTRVTTCQLPVADIARESEYWARQRGHEVVVAEDVERALAERVDRSDLPVRHIRESIARGFLVIALSGRVVGQVNGLVVADLGNISFGWPTRVTARVSAGGRGILALDREVGMGESIYGKGVMILEAWLRSTYAAHVPLSLAVSIVMEQNYTLLAGDSASGVELCAVLSALADVPLDQGLAMTGAVDQFGLLQPIGGVNEKIEGMYAVCREVGLTGKQGVIIPARNLPNLSLNKEVVEAARRGDFHVYAVETIEEALELLTGQQVGVRGADGQFPVGSFNHRVEQRLITLATWYSHYRGGSAGAPALTHSEQGAPRRAARRKASP